MVIIMPSQKEKPGDNTDIPDKDPLDNTDADEKNPFGHTAIYIKDPKTGLWIVKNPSGSIAYNYLYRNDD